MDIYKLFQINSKSTRHSESIQNNRFIHTKIEADINDAIQLQKHKCPQNYTKSSTTTSACKETIQLSQINSKSTRHSESIQNNQFIPLHTAKGDIIYTI